MMNDILKQINAGTSMPRNMFLFNNAIYLLPYTGVGSGITRALDEDINVTFMNNDKAQEFVITVWRGESSQVEGKSNQVGNQVEQKSNQVQDSDTRLRHSDTRLRHSDTDHDTSENDLDTRLRHSGTDLDTSENDLDTLTLKKCHCLKAKGHSQFLFCSSNHRRDHGTPWFIQSNQEPRALHHLPCCSRIFADDQSG